MTRSVSIMFLLIGLFATAFVVLYIVVAVAVRAGRRR